MMVPVVAFVAVCVVLALAVRLYCRMVRAQVKDARS
jgi:hypothetical protein